MTDKPDRQDGDGLRTCPCCAGVSSFAEEWPGHMVACENARCGIRSGIFPTKPMARRAWNNRPTRDGAEGAGVYATLEKTCKDCGAPISEHVIGGPAPYHPRPIIGIPKPAPDAMRSLLWELRAVVQIHVPEGREALFTKIDAFLTAPVPSADGATQAMNEALARHYNIPDELWKGATKDNPKVPPSPAVAAEPVAWADSQGLERPIDAEAMKMLRLNPTTELYWSRFNVPLYASPPVRGDREELLKYLDIFLHPNPEVDLSGLVCKHGLAIEACPSRECANPMAYETAIKRARDYIAGLPVQPAIDKTAAAQIVATCIYGSKLENLEGVQADACRGIVTEILELAGVQSCAGERGSDAAEAERYFDMAGEFGNRIQRAIDVININIGSINRSVAAELKRVLDPENGLSRQAPHSSSETES